MLEVENIVEFGKSIFNLPNFSQPMFYKSVKLISHDPVDLTQRFIQTWLLVVSVAIMKYLDQSGHRHPRLPKPFLIQIVR